ncbi:hypothetical protein EMIHUDRAFT_194939 [Emiliania huxleyi CCMP1516]|uniref:ERCC1-like central domain-containing protein n=2 Tax=Emiliania huxleyi TaxID=2903 RepID=A0A0D3L2D9_EMIH1|nr:hypothetical protein EMIHUDRAFT_194939 [Emiliania huxleyi CCMP1516]EOD42174.1 hypothetical protein EMIHUDRAFT_194939 [Emiliania huxleyi CCMP1516]|eukprot:XP_005794603.1 hypothetical protein EMIHUDRAFT_194939 [Emiliania huxleyi CCMP1516]
MRIVSSIRRRLTSKLWSSLRSLRSIANRSLLGRHRARPPNGVVVSTRQRGNPVLAAIKAVPWAYGPTTADFLIPDGACALFLSLRYHLLHPNYLLARLRELRELTPLRLVLLLVDSEAPERPILTVLQQATAHECTLLLGWSVGEVARYVETLRAYAKKGAESDGTFLAQLTDVLTTSRLVNKTDVATLNNTFGPRPSCEQAPWRRGEG